MVNDTYATNTTEFALSLMARTEGVRRELRQRAAMLHTFDTEDQVQTLHLLVALLGALVALDSALCIFHAREYYPDDIQRQNVSTLCKARRKASSLLKAYDEKVIAELGIDLDYIHKY